MSLPAEIAGQSIAPGGPMRVIAEIGLNHPGDADLAHRLVDACADAGAWAMKLQVFDADELLVADAPAPAHVRAESLRAFFRQFQLNADAYAAIVSHARDRGLAVIATAFDSLSVGMLDRLGIDAFKVASGDLTHVMLIEHLARTGRPLVLSTGMSEEGDVWNAVDWAVGSGARALALLHCVSSYPTPDAQQNLRVVRTLAEEYKLPVGLSDHGMGGDAALLAYAQGATLYERHVHLPGTDRAARHRAAPGARACRHGRGATHADARRDAQHRAQPSGPVCEAGDRGRRTHRGGRCRRAAPTRRPRGRVRAGAHRQPRPTCHRGGGGLRAG
jgi:N-acetylneuraminate synthase/N,N'-diacetyllegionaminate synthase